MFELSAGQIVAEKYRVDGVMGTGGMGVVVSATHIELEQRVAIKFLRVVSTEALARFHREARLLVRLKNPHVARVIDVGSLDDDTPYIVMEHLEGEDLSFLVANNKKLPVEETVDYVLQACEAVAEAHSLGMVHRDLKPANLFLARGAGGTRSVKVLDFGVSKILDERSLGTGADLRGGDLTNEGVALGSPGYMSPEQMTSARDVDARSDIFSLGALLYRLVTGQPAYKGTSPVSILASMAIDGLTPIRSVAPEVPEAFASVVECCLAEDRSARYPTVAHLARALAPFATRRGKVSIEQIIATLNLTFEGEQLGDTINQPVVAPARSERMRISAPGDFTPSPSRPIGPSLPIGPPGPGHTIQTGPHFPPHSASRPSFGPAEPATKPIPQLLTVGLTLLALSVFAGAAAFLVLRKPQGPLDEARPALDPSSATSLTAVPVLPEVTTTPAALTATVIAPPMPAVAPTELPSAAPAPTAEPRPKSVPVRPRGHSTPSHTATPATTSTPTSKGASPPPNPADVPDGRH